MNCIRQNMAARRGFTVTEMSIAMILLGAAIVAVGTFSTSVSRGLDDRELSARIGLEISNFREIIGSWRPESITVDRIQAVPVPELFSSNLQDARWEAQVTEVQVTEAQVTEVQVTEAQVTEAQVTEAQVTELQESVSAKQVTLTLVATYLGQEVRPETLTFWVLNTRTSEEDSLATGEVEERDAESNISDDGKTQTGSQEDEDAI